MSQQEALSELLQRFAISALSIERKEEALNEEILIDKFTGEFYVKSKDGVVISTDILNREKASTNEALHIAELMGMTGELYKIEFDNLSLPKHVDFDVNILQDEPIVVPVNTKSFLLNIDLDEYEVVDGVSNIIHGNEIVTVRIEVVDSGENYIIKKEININNLNYNIFSLENFENLTSIKLTDITINGSDLENRMLLLHNLFISVNN
jgi:hypothetical protein